MYLSLSQAAKQTGKSKSIISKHLNDGTLSYVSKDDSGYKIDPSELFRVFSKRTQNGKKERNRTSKNDHENATFETKLQALMVERDIYKTQLAKSEQREQDLSAKLDKAQSTIDKQTYLITDLRDTASQAMTKKTNFFSNLFSKAD